MSTDNMEKLSNEHENETQSPQIEIGELNGPKPIGLAKTEEDFSELDTLAGTLFRGEYTGYLGYGYNVLTKRYYNEADVSVSKPILNMNKVFGTPSCQSSPLRIFVNNTVAVDFSKIVGLYAEEYSKKFAAKAGIGVESGAFKASFNTAFTQESKISASKSFATGRIEITHRREYFDLSELTTENLMQDFLSAGFKRDVNDSSISGESLFNNYGTHLLLDLRMGGRMEFNFLHEKSSDETENSLEVSVEASYSCFKGSASVEMRDKASKMFETSSFSSQLLGGDASTDISSMEQAISGYTKWAESLKPDTTSNPRLALIGTGSLDNPASVIPVWELADSKSRRDKLKAEFGQILAINGGYFKNLQDKVLTQYIKNIYVGYNGKNMEASITDVYAKMSADDPSAPRKHIAKDLNRSAGGQYECLGYTLTTDPDEAIRDIRGNTNEKDRCESSYYDGGCTYTKLHCDLNKGARGHFVYLYWTKDKAAGKPLLDADVEINYSFDHRGEPGWQRVRLIGNSGDLNINRGTGGKTYDIFAWFKKEL